jgi:Cd2+/Zn2+-exporting ATPase
MLLAISGASLSQDYFDGSLIVTLFLLAELIETIVMFRVRKAVQLSSVGIIPSYTYLIDGSKIAIYDIKIGDILPVRAGEMILADGRVIKGECIVDESALTGESIPIQKNITDIVKSGTILQNGYIELRVSVASKDSTLQRQAVMMIVLR